MKLAVIGGGGARVPLLCRGLTASDLPIEEIALYDLAPDRAEVMAALARRVTREGVRLRVAASPEECVEGAAFVVTSIRVGGVEARARDEGIALAHGVLGQETVGPAGFALALRTIPAMAEYGRLVERRAPGAWMINFTNPAGMITQAVRAASGARVIGICDTPIELLEAIAAALELPTPECAFDYVGLNHLGWVREVWHRGRPLLERLFADRARLERVYRLPLFPIAELEAERLLPTEYVYFYRRAADAVANLRRAGASRGAHLVELNRRLYRDLAGAADPVGVYERYLAARDGSYFQLESGAAAPQPRSPWAEVTGYDKIALRVIRAVHHDRRDVLPLAVPNGDNLPGLERADVVEVPCVIDANGPRPLHAGAPPAAVAGLIARVKEYERLTVEAAIARSGELARRALAVNPLVADPALADRLIADLGLPW